MIPFEKAKETASSLLPDADQRTEHSNAWAFSNKAGRMNIGGFDIPIVVLKETGKTVDTTRVFIIL